MRRRDQSRRSVLSLTDRNGVRDDEQPAVNPRLQLKLLDGRFVSLRRLGADDAEAVVTLHQHSHRP